MSVQPPKKSGSFRLRKNYLLYLVGFVACGIAPLLLKMGYMLWESQSDGVPLRIKWEGAWLDLNTRDVGDSVNECLGMNFMRPGALTRSNGWFSGWSCDRVGKPDVIYSLNHDPTRQERYYCRADGYNLVGRDFGGPEPLKDLEFLENWSQPHLRQTACAFFDDSFQSIANGKKVLVHCDAGRDRTGTYAALITALVAESTGLLDERMLEAIECDYRKTASLSPDKFGRMKHFITSLMQEGGIRIFFEKKCGIQPKTLDDVVKTLKYQ